MTRRQRLPRRLALALVAAGGAACGGGGGGSGSTPATWRSSLFPADWTPATTAPDGGFLHDVGYAGYRGGTAPLPDGSTLPTVDVVIDHGADPTGATDTTAAIQAAIDAAEALAPARVRIPAGLYRVDGFLVVEANGVVLAGDGPASSRLWFPRATGMTDAANLTLRGASIAGADLPLTADAAARASDVFVADASGLSVGDDVVLGWTISPAFVTEHGMDGTWGPFNGTWQVFDRRTVVALELGGPSDRVTLDVPLRHAALLRDGASLRRVTGLLAECGVLGLGLANGVAWADAWASDRAHVLRLVDTKDCWVEDVASYPSPSAPVSGAGAGAHLQSGGVLVERSKRATLAACRMEAAQHRGGGGNGYLFEVLQSGEILHRDCVARAGRHNFVQNWGFGTTGCVWLRCTSSEGIAEVTSAFPGLGTTGFCEYHHSLATANLVDGCVATDGWAAGNRGLESSGAGHTATECVFWRHRGGVLRSRQFGRGYVLGTFPGTSVEAGTTGTGAAGTSPADTTEGLDDAAALVPASLYEEQHRLRTGTLPESAGP